jgi:hypothetical protein
MDRRDFLKGLGAAVVAGALSSSEIISQAAPENIDRTKELSDLENSLNRAFPDAPIKLKIGTDFEDQAGTVIFISREQGMEKMVSIAREAKPELSILFLPARQAWIAISKSRETEQVESDKRYIEAALMTEEEVELWHTHNDEGVSEISEEKHKKLSMMWAMPYTDDFVQIYKYAREIPNSKLTGVVANIYGITIYKSNDPELGNAIYKKSAVMNEAEQLRLSVENASPSDLENLASSHKGFIKLTFLPVK